MACFDDLDESYAVDNFTSPGVKSCPSTPCRGGASFARKFLDIVRKVTNSPILGQYLTHVGSTSHVYDSRFPNGNFCKRGLMQFGRLALRS